MNSYDVVSGSVDGFINLIVCAAVVFGVRGVIRRLRGTSGSPRKWGHVVLLWGLAGFLALGVASSREQESAAEDSPASPTYTTADLKAAMASAFMQWDNVETRAQAECMSGIVYSYAPTVGAFQALPPTERDYVLRQAYQRCEPPATPWWK